MLRGDLSDVTLPELLGFLASTSKSGELLLEGPSSAGRLVLRAGAVADATPARRRSLLLRRVVGRGLLDADGVRTLLAEVTPVGSVADTGTEVVGDRAAAELLLREGRLEAGLLDELLREHLLDATFELLRWEGGSFRFQVGEPQVDDRLALLAAEELISGASERLERWDDLVAATGPGGRILTMVAPGEGDPPTLSADAWRLIALIDGVRPLDELVALTGRGGFDVRSTVQELQDAGLVPAPDDAGHAAGVTDVMAAQRILDGLDEVGPAAEAPRAHGHGPGDDAWSTEEPTSASRDVEPAFWTPLAPEPRTEVDADALGAALLAELPEPDPDARSTARHTDLDEPADDASELRRPKLRTDPTLDVETVDRLIDGIKALR